MALRLGTVMATSQNVIARVDAPSLPRQLMRVSQATKRRARALGRSRPLQARPAGLLQIPAWNPSPRPRPSEEVCTGPVVNLRRARRRSRTKTAEYTWLRVESFCLALPGPSGRAPCRLSTTCGVSVNPSKSSGSLRGRITPCSRNRQPRTMFRL